MSTPHPRGTAILLVDDDPGVLSSTKRLLEQRGHRVVACRSGEEALDHLAHATFDVMLSDVQMPGITGLALLRAVRERDLDIPVVLMTGNPEVQSAATAVEYGAFHYLIKPVDIDELEGTIARAAQAGSMARLKRVYIDAFGDPAYRVGDRAGSDATLDSALASLWLAYQPIVLAADGSTFAQEALLRSDEPALATPAAVLNAAARTGRLHDVGRQVRARVAQALLAAPPTWSIFVNIDPQDLLDVLLYLPDAPLTLVSRRIVLEVTERASLDAVPDTRGRIAQLRELGFRIALDDLGAGYAGLTSFTVLEPEFVKLDMTLIREVHQSKSKQKIIGAMVRLCHDMGKQIIAEGIEERAERDALVELGCDLLQGYWFAKPGRAFPIPSCN